jgi:ribosomal protein S18 acetylase RimI-like enzyme
LQRPLTQTAMRWLRRQASGPMDLESYGDGWEAVAIYQELGFELQEHYIEYSKLLK